MTGRIKHPIAWFLAHPDRPATRRTDVEMASTRTSRAPEKTPTRTVTSAMTDSTTF